MTQAPTPLDPVPTTAVSPPPVVLIPPLLVPSPIMWPMALRLRRAGRSIAVFRYHSWSRDIPENARMLAEFLHRVAREKEADALDIVAYSLGGILLRWAANHHDLPPLRRVVMLGPPNQGAFMADWMWDHLGPIFPLVWGKCAFQLRRGPRGLPARAGRLPHGTQLGIISAGRGNPKGFNPIIPGDNDLTVGVQETILPGMSDFVLVRRHTHTMLVLTSKSSALVEKFLTTGYFRNPGAKKKPH